MSKQLKINACKDMKKGPSFTLDTIDVALPEISAETTQNTKNQSHMAQL